MVYIDFFLDRNGEMWKLGRHLRIRKYSGNSAVVMLNSRDDPECHFAHASFAAFDFDGMRKIFDEIGYIGVMPQSYHVTSKDFENEVKLEVPSESRLGELRKSLELEGKLILDTIECNYVVDRDNELLSEGRLLRIRDEEIWFPERKNQTMITYKGSSLSSEFKKKLEINVRVNNFQMTSQLFRHLGFKVEGGYRKIRQVYDVDGVHVFLDRAYRYSLDTPISYYWRKFVEIEGTNEEIKGMMERFRMDDLKLIELSYCEIL